MIMLLFCAACLLAASPVAARDQPRGDDRDQTTRIRAAVARGQLLPLPRVLAIARARVPGRLLDVELEEDGRRLLYEVKILTRSGRVVEVTVNARNGRILEVEED